VIRASGTTGVTRFTDSGGDITMTLSETNSVGIGTLSPAQLIHGETASGNAYIRIARASKSAGQVGLQIAGGTSSTEWFTYVPSGEDDLVVFGNSSNRTRIDTNGNFMVGRDAVGATGNGPTLRPADSSIFTRDGGESLILNRDTSDGNIIVLRKGGSDIGAIGTVSASLSLGSGDCFLEMSGAGNTIQPMGSVTGAASNGVIDLGASARRFKDIFASNGTIQTSDRNEKQDIEELSEAEQRVAVAAKGLLRKYRWKSAVSEKGDDARIHFGIIAQDLQDAFTAEGLDAGRYAMFCSDTWWEVETEIEEDNTRLEIFNTAEEAPEGATQRTRLGVRYSQLLAFIISAI